MRSLPVPCLRPLLGALVLALFAPTGHAQDCSFPTVPGLRAHRQPDGSRIELAFRGSGANHWFEDADGYPVVRTAEGYVFARRGLTGRLEATGTLVGSADPRSLPLERHVVPTAERPAARVARPHQGPRDEMLTAGSVNNLVLLLRFANHGPAGQNRTLPSVADVSAIMNAVGGDPVLAPTGSVRDHYLEDSYGQLTIDSTVIGWLDLPGTEAYYANGNAGLTTLTWDLITDGLNAADPLVNFGDFDLDGDGWVDAITFLHSGYAAEWGADDQYGTEYFDRIWSHKWTIPTWTSAEGVRVGDYNISPGLWGVDGDDPGRIGVVCHELGHFFGLPDLYDTDGSSEGAGNWCLMAAGSWGFDGTQHYPSHMCGWCKTKLGWVSPERLLPGPQTALASATGPALYMIDSGYPPGEYLLIENRQPLGFDAQLPVGGLAIWHVDESKGSFTYNDPNSDEGYPGQSGWPANGRHYRVSLLQADGDFDLENGNNRGDSTDLYRNPGFRNLSATTNPNSDAYQDGAIVTTSNRLQFISVPGASMTYTYSNLAAPEITSGNPPIGKVGVPYSATLASTGGTAPFTWSEFLDDPSYTLTDLGAQPFAGGGVAQSFQADEGRLAVDLPFLFPYYETSYSRVWVTPNGCIDLAPLDSEAYNTSGILRALPRIAGLWDDLTTDAAAGQDVYVDTSVGGQVRFRWEAERVGSGLPANFSITLHQDGRIRFDYGSGNTGLSPTVGISRSHSGDVLLAATHDAQTTLTDADSLEFTLQGSALPPGLSLSPSGVLSGIPLTAGTFTFRVRVRDAQHRTHQKRFKVVVADRLQRAKTL